LTSLVTISFSKNIKLTDTNRNFRYRT